MVTLITPVVHAQGRFNEMVYDKTQTVFHLNAPAMPKVRIYQAGIAGEEESIKFGIVGSIAHPQVDMTRVNYDKKPWATHPTQQISYVSCHDDMCLVDRLKASVPSLTDTSKSKDDRTAELIRLDLLAQTAVFTSQGVPFMLAGEEMLRTRRVFTTVSHRPTASMSSTGTT